VRKTRIVLALLVGGMATGFLAGPWKARPAVADEDNSRKISILDDCDPDDPAWNRTGGCTLPGGDVTEMEFNAGLTSPLANGQLIGHQAWRNEPSYLKIETDGSVRVRNRGGRTHTFTEVAAFGGGRVAPLNQGQEPAPECAAATNLPPGAGVQISGFTPGNHKFQCCIHPWMRAIVKVK
jgi:hypothetical protein